MSVIPEKESEFPNLTPEQLEEELNRRKLFMEKRIPYLEIENRYMNLKAQIAEHKANELEQTFKYLQILNSLKNKTVESPGRQEEKSETKQGNPDPNY